MKKEFKVGNYEQTIETNKGKVVKVWCTCLHASLFPLNWDEGKTLCWHLKSAVILYKKDGIKKTN